MEDETKQEEVTAVPASTGEKTGKPESKFKAFLKRKQIEISPKRYFIDAMGSMALALFATLLMSSILGTLGDLIFGDVNVSTINFQQAIHLDFLHVIEAFASKATGMAIGAAIAYSLKGSPLVIFASAAVGALANDVKFGGLAANSAEYIGIPFVGDMRFAAGPAGVFFVVIIAVEIGKMVSKETKVDILVTPLTVLIVGYVASWVICPIISFVMYWIAKFIAVATAFVPLLMGAVIAVVVGMILTLPISSAAICASIFAQAMIDGSSHPESLYLAAGAACVGCCCQMVGFAATSFRENKWGGLVAQGIGTSMLQMGNICKNPRIWIAPTLAGAICGALSTTVFRLKCVGLFAGMGTCGLVGPIGLFAAADTHDVRFWLGLVLLCFVLPAALSFGFDYLFRRIGWVKDGDQKLAL